MRRDHLTWWCYAAVAAYAFVLNGFGPVLVDVREDLDISRTVTGLHGTGLAAGTLLAGLAGERLRRAAGWTGMFWTGTATLLAGVLGLWAATSPWVSVPAAGLIGGGGTLLLVMAPALLGARHGASVGTAVSEAHATASLLGVVAPLAVGASLAAFGLWLPAFLLAAAVALPLLGLRAPELPAAAGLDAGQLRAERLPRGYWRWWTALLFGVATEFAVLLWAADDAHERLGLSTEVAVVAPSAFLLGMAAARGFGARLLSIRPHPGLFRRAAVLASGAFVVYHATDGVALALAGLVGVGLGVGLLYPTSLAAGMAAAPGAEAQASTRTAVAAGLAVAGGPLVLGALADAYGIASASWVVLALLAAAVVATPRDVRASPR